MRPVQEDKRVSRIFSCWEFARLTKISDDLLDTLMPTLRNARLIDDSRNRVENSYCSSLTHPARRGFHGIPTSVHPLGNINIDSVAVKCTIWTTN